MRPAGRLFILSKEKRRDKDRKRSSRAGSWSLTSNQSFEKCCQGEEEKKVMPDGGGWRVLVPNRELESGRERE